MQSKINQILRGAETIRRNSREEWKERAEKSEAEVERIKEQYESAAESVARMHEAAVGEIRGPIISVIEDIKAVRQRAEKAEAEVERLKGLVMDAARKGDELLEPYRLRAEKAETLLKQIQAFIEALNQTNKTNDHVTDHRLINLEGLFD